MSLSDVHIMMFYGHPQNVNLTKFITIINLLLLKYSFRVPPGSKNNSVYPMSRNIWRDAPRTS